MSGQANLEAKVTYGVASSSNLAIRSFVELTIDDEIPRETSKAIQRDVSMDDILRGATSGEEAEQLQARLITTLEKGQFELRKWTCSEPRVTLSLPPEYREAN